LSVDKKLKKHVKQNTPAKCYHISVMT